MKLLVDKTEKIIKQLKDESSKKRRAITQEAQKKSKELVSSAKEEAKITAQREEEVSLRAAEQEAESMRSAAKLLVRQNYERMRGELVEEIYQGIKTDFLKTSDKHMQKLYKKALTQVDTKSISVVRAPAKVKLSPTPKKLDSWSNAAIQIETPEKLVTYSLEDWLQEKRSVIKRDIVKALEGKS